MGVHDDRGHLKKGKQTSRPTSVDSPIKRDAVFLNKNKKWVTKKYYGNHEKLNEMVGKQSLNKTGQSGLHVIHYIYAKHVSLEDLAEHRNKSKELP
jgi:hypothetical protein